MPKNRYKLLAISGSLRKISYNSALNRAVREIAPEHIEVTLFDQMGDIPLFNPDLEDDLHPAVSNLKHAIKQSDGLIISSPEYAHGISGVMKNTLDWLVSGDEFVYKPILFFNGSPRAKHAQAQLREIVTTMSGLICEEASADIPLLGSQMRTQDIVNDSDLAAVINTSLDKFCGFIDCQNQPN